MTRYDFGAGTIRPMRLLFTVMILFAVMTFMPRAVQATIYYVAANGSDANTGLSWASPKKDLQAALQATTYYDYDQVWVKKGTYSGSVTGANGVAVYGGFAGTETSIRQRNISANPTILDGGGTGIVYTIATASVTPNILDGFTVQHGSGILGAGLVDMASDTLIVSHCTFLENSAYEGAGVFTGSGYVTITNCRFVHNNAEINQGDSDGGGVYTGGPATITHCLFTDNTAFGGAGIWTAPYAHATIADCSFTNNSAVYGGGVSSGGVDTITDCTFTANTASDVGAIESDRNPVKIARCVFTRNSVDAVEFYATGFPTLPTVVKDCLIIGAGRGTDQADGVFVSGSSTVVLSNNTIVATNVGIDLDYPYQGQITSANNIVSASAVGLLVGPSGFAGFTSSHDDFFGNETNMQGFTPGASDLSVDPRFVNPAGGNYRLGQNSPCIDAGDDSFVGAHDMDLAGHARIQGSQVDLGCYEAVPAPAITSFSPAAAPVGTVITILGTNLKDVTAVRFGETSTTEFGMNEAGTILFVAVPEGAAKGKITVRTRGGAVKTATPFQVIPPIGVVR